MVLRYSRLWICNESWDSFNGGDYFGAAVSFAWGIFDVVTLGEATVAKNLAVEGVEIAVKTAGRAFFSGVGTEARAIEDGFQTLGQTRAGRNLQNLIDSRNIPWSEAEPMWQRLSVPWAKGVPNGSLVPAFLNNPRAGAIWFKTELPILQQKGVNIIYK